MILSLLSSYQVTVPAAVDLAVSYRIARGLSAAAAVSYSLLIDADAAAEPATLCRAAAAFSKVKLAYHPILRVDPFRCCVV